MARVINTVTGPISKEEMGAVLSHEHFSFGYSGYLGDETESVWDEEKYYEFFAPIIEKIKAQGIKTIVDATPNDCGRDVELLKRTSEKFGINIICVTGYYHEHGGAPAYWNFRRNFGFPAVEEVSALMRKELNEGIAKTGIKAGAIKIGSGIGEITDYEKLFFEAASIVAKEDPDVRIMTHCSHGTMLREQAEFFMERGVNPEQVLLGHFCDTIDLSAQLDVLGMGFYAGFDRLGQVGFDGMPFDDDRLAAICALTAAGYGDKIVISNDRVYWFLGREFPFPQSLVDAIIKEWEWPNIFDIFIPRLKEMGLSEEQVMKFVVDNPQRFHGGE